MGAADPTRDITMATDRDDHDFEPTPHLFANRSRPHGIAALRPPPLPGRAGSATAARRRCHRRRRRRHLRRAGSDAGDTRLEPDLEDLLWSTVNLFHRAIDRIERDLDDNEQAQRRSQKEQDGSEVRSVELERLTAQGLTLIERRNAMECFRDQAADQFERHTGSAWRPRSGSYGQPSHAHRGHDRQPRLPRRQATRRQ